MKKPEPTDQQRMSIALRAGAYVRWVELRKQRTPSHDERGEWIAGLLDGEDLSSIDNEVHIIDSISLTLDPGGVEAFAKSIKYFETLDEVDAKYNALQKKSPG